METLPKRKRHPGFSECGEADMELMQMSAPCWREATNINMPRFWASSPSGPFHEGIKPQHNNWLRHVHADESESAALEYRRADVFKFANDWDKAPWRIVSAR